MVDFCRCNGKRRCYHGLVCDFIDSLGNVHICVFHDNPSGFFAERKRVPILRSIWNKHFRSGS